jgi:serine/threonine protein kinase
MTEKINPEDIRKSKQRVPAGTFYHQIPDEEVDSLVLNKLNSTGQYRNVARFKDAEEEGSSSRFYKAVYLPTPNAYPLPVIIKVDRPDSQILSDHAKENSKRGYNIANAIKFLTLLSQGNPEEHHLARFITGYQERASNGEELAILIEKDYKHLKSLKSLVEPLKKQNDVSEEVQEQHGILSYEEWGQVFGDVLKAVAYISRSGYHRDISPSNILIGPRGTIPQWGKPILEARLTDFSLSCERQDADEKAIPTFGRRTCVNPFLFEKFTGQKTAYSEADEIFSIGNTMYYALTGKEITRCDPKLGTVAVVTSKGLENVLNEDGRIDESNFTRAIHSALNESGIKRKYAKIIENCLLSRTGKGYDKISALEQKFKDLKPNLFKKWMPAVAGLALAGVAMTFISAEKEHQLKDRLASQEMKTFDAEHKNLDKEFEKYSSAVGEFTNGSNRAIESAEKLLKAVEGRDYDTDIQHAEREIKMGEATLKKARLDYEHLVDTYASKSNSIAPEDKVEFERAIGIAKEYTDKVENIFNDQIKPMLLETIEDGKKLKAEREKKNGRL